MVTKRRIVAQQPGEPPTKRCNGPLHNGAQVRVEEFGLAKFQRLDGTFSRKAMCRDCVSADKRAERSKVGKRRGRPPGCKPAPTEQRAMPVHMPMSTPARPEQIGVARQPGEPEMRRCNGPFCDGQHRPVEQFGVTKRKYRNGNFQRRLRCLACEGVTNREYEAKQQQEGKEAAQEKRKKPPIAYTSTGKRISLAWLSKNAIILFDVDGTRYVENANEERVQHLRAAGVLPTPTDERAWSRVVGDKAS